MRRILVVDDDEQMVRTICDIIRLRGMQAEGVFSGEAAIETVRREPFDAILMDVRMTGMNGVEAMKTLRSVRPGLRVILMTAYTTAELLTEAEREGAVRIMQKPVAIPALLDMLAEPADGAPKVLIVDDDPQFLSTLSAALRLNGYEALAADSIHAAISQLESDRPLAVLLDLSLRDITPSQSIIAIRRISPAVVLILCSGYAARLDDVVASVPSSWIFASLRKPFPPDRLLSLLDELTAS